MEINKNDLDGFIQIFIRWLKTNEIYKDYFKEVKKQKSNIYNIERLRYYFIQRNVLHLTSNRLDNHMMRRIIDISFSWNGTDRGFGFWSLKNKEWGEYVSNNIIITA